MEKSRRAKKDFGNVPGVTGYGFRTGANSRYRIDSCHSGITNVVISKGLGVGD